MKLFPVAVTLLALSLFPLRAFCAEEKFFYQGNLELLAFSGGSCSTALQRGSRVSVDLVVRVDGRGGKETIEGYLASPDTRTLRFSGDDSGKLALYHADAAVAAASGASSSVTSAAGAASQGLLSVDGFHGERLTGLLTERHLAVGAEGCNIDLGRVSVTRSRKGGAEAADSLLGWFATRYRAESEFAGGYALFRSGRLSDAVPRLESAVRLREELDGTSSQNLIGPALYLAVSKAALGSYDDGFRLVDRVSRIPVKGKSPEQLQQYAVDLMCSQAVALYDDGKQDLSLALSGQILARFPDNPHAVISNAGILMADGDLEQGCQLLDQALAKHPDHAEYRVELAACLQKSAREQFDSDDPSPSMALYLRALELKPGDFESLDGMLAAFAARGTPADGYQLLKKHSAALVKEYGKEKLDNGYAFVSAEEAKLAEITGDLARAEALLAKAVDFSPEEPGYAIALARVKHKAGRFPEAARLLSDRRRLCKDESCRAAFDAAIEREGVLERLLERLHARR